MSPRQVVIDTNVLISAVLSPDGTAYRALEKAYRIFQLVQSRETYQELVTRIYKRKFDKYLSNEDRKYFLTVVQDNSQFIQTVTQISDCRDLDDNKFLELAKDSNAEFLITGDQDLLLLQSQAEYQGLIVTPRKFLGLEL